jgi:putative multiple sugar transport system ATP-binding protein
VSEYLLEMNNITKEYPGVVALNDVSFKVKKGEIHALVGENGAGKSTLMKVLSGVLPKGTYSGEILFEGQNYQIKSLRQSEEKGVGIIHQEFTLTPNLSIAENIFLGKEIKKFGIINWDQTKIEAAKLLKRVGLEEDVNILVKNIGVGKMQLVEIAKALSKDVKLLILDEPTAALNENESAKLMNLLLSLKQNGITAILISHKLNEVLKVAERVTILRDGKSIETLDMKKDLVDEDRIVKGMVGREITDRFPQRNAQIKETLFEIRNWNVYHPHQDNRKICDDINLEVKAGEVVGIAGLMGAGRTELAMSVFGRSYGKNISGEVYVNGEQIDTRRVDLVIKSGVAYVSEDRKGLGLILDSTIKSNITLSNLDRVPRHHIIDKNREIANAIEAVDNFRIKCTNVDQKVLNLSGGNQQKVVLAKWIFCESEVYILDEPTRGIDVGAKHEIYKLINLLVESGKAVLFISSELPEILGLCDRIYVMSGGKIKGELKKEEASQEKIMKLIV